MPIIRRFERWMRSYDSAITARTPRRFGPFAAQSRDEPEPYSLPGDARSSARPRRGSASPRRRSSSPRRPGGAPSTCPRCPATSWLRSRTFANVPRTITSWLPRREPYELKSRRSTPCSIEVLPGRRVGPDRAGRGDVVGRDRVAEHDEAARAVDVLDRSGLARHPVEVRRQAHVRRLGVPRVEIARRGLERAPAVVAGEDVRVRAS